MSTDKEIFTQESEVGAKNTKAPRMVPKYVLVIAMVLIVICTLVAGIFIGINVYGVTKDGKEMLTKMPYLDEMYKLIDQYYYKDVNWNEVQDRTIAGMAKMDLFSGITIQENIAPASVGVVFSPTEYNELFVSRIVKDSPADTTRGKETNIVVNPITKDLSIRDVPGASLDKKIERGDMLVAIKTNDKEPYIYVPGIRYQEVINLLRLPMTRGLIFRKMDGSYIEINVGKENNTDKIAFYEFLGNDTGYICLTEFDDDNVDDFFEAAAEFIKDDRAHKLIFDLRSNGGGNVKLLAKIIPFFINKKAPAIDIMKITKKNDEPTIIKGVNHSGANGLINDYFGKAKGKTYKLAVMVDGGSASASEAFIGAVRYYEPNTIIVGTPTYGKGVAQYVFEVASKYTISIVAGEFFVLTGELGKGDWQNFHGKPMLPTYNFLDEDKFDEHYGVLYPNVSKDVDIQKAMELLKK